MKRRALLVAWGFGKGRSMACTGDMVPPREPRMFNGWNGDGELWSRILRDLRRNLVFAVGVLYLGTR